MVGCLYIYSGTLLIRTNGEKESVLRCPHFSGNACGTAERGVLVERCLVLIVRGGGGGGGFHCNSNGVDHGVKSRLKMNSKKYVHTNTILCTIVCCVCSVPHATWSPTWSSDGCSSQHGQRTSPEDAPSPSPWRSPHVCPPSPAPFGPPDPHLPPSTSSSPATTTTRGCTTF